MQRERERERGGRRENSEPYTTVYFPVFHELIRKCLNIARGSGFSILLFFSSSSSFSTDKQYQVNAATISSQVFSMYMKFNEIS